MYFNTLNLAVLLAVVHLPSGWKVIATNQFILPSVNIQLQQIANCSTRVQIQDPVFKATS